MHKGHNHESQGQEAHNHSDHQHDKTIKKIKVLKVNTKIIINTNKINMARAIMTIMQ